MPGADGACLTSLAWVAPPGGGPAALVSGGLDSALTVWNLATRAPSSTTPSGGGAVWSLALHPSGECVAAACDDGAARVFSLGGDGALALARALPRAPSRAISVAWHPSGRGLVTGHADGTLRAWDADRGRELFRAGAGAGAGPGKGGATAAPPIWAVAVLPDGTIASGDGAGAVRLWDAEHGTAVATFAGAHAADVLSLAPCAAPGGRPQLFSAGADGRVACFQGGGSSTRGGGWAAGPTRAPHGGHDARCLAALPGAGLLASGGGDAHVVVHGVATFGGAHPARACRAPQAPLLAAAPAREPRSPPLLLSVQRRTADLYALGVPTPRGDAGARASGWGWAEGAPVDVAVKPRALARVALAGARHAGAAALAPGGAWIALASPERTTLFAVDVGACEGAGGEAESGARAPVARTPLPASVPPAAALAFAGPHRLLVAAADGGLAVVDLGPGAPPSLAARLAPPAPPAADADADAAPSTPTYAPSGVVASPDGRWAAVHGPAGASVFDLESLSFAWAPPLPPAGGPLAAAAFDADSRLLLLTAGGGLSAFDVAARSPAAWAGARAAGAPPPRLAPLPGAAVGLSPCPAPGSRRVLVSTPAALCAADLGAPPTPAPPPTKRRRTRAPAPPAPAGANPRPLPLEHACLHAAYVSAGAALLVERPWCDVAASLPPPLARARFGE